MTPEQRNSTLTEHINHFPWFINWQIERLFFGPRVAKPMRSNRGRYAQEQDQRKRDDQNERQIQN